MKTQFSTEKMLLKWLLLLQQLLLEGPLLETSDSVPLLKKEKREEKKKGGGSPFQKNVIGLFLNVPIGRELKGMS